MKNPCRVCERLGQDKSGPECTYCRQRIDYIRHIGGFPDAREMSIMESVEIVKTPSPPPDSPAAKPHLTCSVAGCDGKYFAKGLCSRHYEKKRKEAVKKTKRIAPGIPAEDPLQAAPEEGGSHGLMVDIARIPGITEILEQVRREGEREMRPLAYQIAKILRDAVAARAEQREVDHG